MRRYLAIAGLLTVLAIPVAATAADLSNGNGQACGEDQAGVWHFVNNQTGGAAQGQIWVTFDTGTVTKLADKVLANTQHFTFMTSGAVTLVDAETNLPGRLQLSDFSCVGTKGGGKK